MGLSSLPDEVLDLALKCLLPPFRSQSLAITYVFTVPVDLLALRLVSRRLHRLATPLAWRRAQLRIASPSAMNYGNCGIKHAGAAALAAARTLARSRFFHEHPELAAHVRILLISLEWQAERPDLARDALCAATRPMCSLRTVLVWDTDMLAIREIPQILQKPLLRTICFMDVDGSAFPARCDLGAGVKMMHIANSKHPARLVAGAGSALECVSIELAKSGSAPQPAVTLLEMPWKTLKEVALVDCADETDWFCFLDGFELHKRLGLHTALTELMVGDLAGLESDRVDQLLHTFAGHPLARLTLYHVMTFEPSTVLAHIVKAFPVLRHLTLLTEGVLAPWPGTLDSYAQLMAGLPHLKTLEWNNFTLDPAMDCVFLSLGNEALGVLYADHAHALVRHVCQLRYIKFISVVECIVDTVYVGGTNSGSSCPVEVRRESEAVLHTSSWSTTSHTFQDI